LGPAHVSTGTRLQTEAPLDRRLLQETVDIVIGEPPDPAARPLVGVEVKTGPNARKLGQTPYHTFKLASMRRLDGVEATYLVVAATTQSFSGDEPGAELFKTPVGHSEEWYSSYFLEEWGHAWAQSLDDDRGRAMHLPRTLRLQLVCIQQVPAFADWEIRV